MKCTDLRYTNLLLLIPFIILLNKKKTHFFEYLLLLLLLFVIISSQLFWNNPIKNSLIHKIDAIIAKIVLLLFIFYILYFKKNKNKYKIFLIIILIMICAYLSNLYSNKEWCSNLHIIFHGLFHIFCLIGILFIFI